MTPIVVAPKDPPYAPTPSQDAGTGGLVATLLVIAVVAAALVWLAKPWRRSKLPRARATIKPDDDSRDEQS